MYNECKKSFLHGKGRLTLALLLLFFIKSNTKKNDTKKITLNRNFKLYK